MSNKHSDHQADALENKSVKFSGYTIDQLRYKLVYTTLQKEFCKDKLISTLHKAVDATPFIGKSAKQSPVALGGGVLSKVFKTLSYADYLIVGFSAFKTVKNIISLFRRK